VIINLISYTYQYLVIIFIIIAYTYAGVYLTLSNRRLKKINQDGKIIDNIVIDLNCTIDHRFMDGALGAKVTAEVFNCLF
jgi:pyruvate/2-oxoglutarate dehydrogenase complex dihydrolipoamide acyltransferase (E2) component